MTFDVRVMCDLQSTASQPLGHKNEAGTPGSQFSPCAPVLELKARIARQMQKSFEIVWYCQHPCGRILQAHSTDWSVSSQKNFGGCHFGSLFQHLAAHPSGTKSRCRDQCKSGGKTLLMSFADCYHYPLATTRYDQVDIVHTCSIVFQCASWLNQLRFCMLRSSLIRLPPETESA